MTYLQNKTMELNSDYYEWTDIIDELRHNLNDAKKHPKDIDLNKYSARHKYAVPTKIFD